MLKKGIMFEIDRFLWMEDKKIVLNDIMQLCSLKHKYRILMFKSVSFTGFYLMSRYIYHHQSHDKVGS